MSGLRATDDRSSLPLAGVQVLDLSRVVSGPLCSRLLADLGADVIKVEPPEGDVTRTAQPLVDQVSPYFAQMNAGKRAITVDLKNPDGAAVVERLAARADVLLENFRPGVLTRLGLDPQRLRETNPGLIVCSVTGWGQTGPWRGRKAYAPLVHAQAGLIEMASRLRGRPAEQETQIHGDVYAAVFAACSVLAALHQRSLTGRGQVLDVAMAQALLYANEWAGVELQRPTTEQLRARPGEYTELDRGGFDIWLHPVFLLGDGSQVALIGRAVTQLPAILETLDADRRLVGGPAVKQRQPGGARHVRPWGDCRKPGQAGEFRCAVGGVCGLSGDVRRSTFVRRPCGHRMGGRSAVDRRSQSRSTVAARSMAQRRWRPQAGGTATSPGRAFGRHPAGPWLHRYGNRAATRFRRRALVIDPVRYRNARACRTATSARLPCAERHIGSPGRSR